MSNNSGTLVIAPIRPQSSADQYPTAYANELLGGHQSVPAVSDRDAIPAGRRAEGMTVWVIATAKLYVLAGGTANTNWTPYSVSSSGVNTFVFSQLTPSSTWSIAHNLGGFPSVEIADSAGSLLDADIRFIDGNNVVVLFAVPVSGVAYLN